MMLEGTPREEGSFMSNEHRQQSWVVLLIYETGSRSTSNILRWNHFFMLIKHLSSILNRKGVCWILVVLFAELWVDRSNQQVLERSPMHWIFLSGSFLAWTKFGSNSDLGEPMSRVPILQHLILVVGIGSFQISFTTGYPKFMIGIYLPNEEVSCCEQYPIRIMPPLEVVQLFLSAAWWRKGPNQMVLNQVLSWLPVWRGPD